MRLHGHQKKNKKKIGHHAKPKRVSATVPLRTGADGKEVVLFVNRLGDTAAESERIPKGAFVRWEMQLLLVTVQRGNAEMSHRSGLAISHEQGLRNDAGFAVPVLIS